jgi:hypothetical protein
MDGSLVWSNRHHQSGTPMPSGAVHPIIPGLAAGQNPESRRIHRPLIWIPGSREGRAPE